MSTRLHNTLSVAVVALVAVAIFWIVLVTFGQQIGPLELVLLAAVVTLGALWSARRLQRPHHPSSRHRA